ncbi:hypothetical protein NDU88_001224 [Pleurodeles waltl]|uniref:Uncharacterized protein n=1 Tax=Pleurodeles waltl TaxID=8319 RepID=A0AAV7VB98_PLEWA|nr:hypothetical protein NDU88_001224 [Pleurodeles waltl]
MDMRTRTVVPGRALDRLKRCATGVPIVDRRHIRGKSRGVVGRCPSRSSTPLSLLVAVLAVVQVTKAMGY